MRCSPACFVYLRAFSHYKKAYADLFKPAPPPGAAAAADAQAAAAPAAAAAPDEAAAAVEGDSKAPADAGTDAPAPDAPAPSSEPNHAPSGSQPAPAATTSGLDASRPRQLSGAPASQSPPPLFDAELEYGWRVFVCLRSKLLLLQGASDLVTATNGLIVTLVSAVRVSLCDAQAWWYGG